jgi:peptidyl-prolyl cis-trans isomerase B (cyclophilin B)
MVLLDMVPPLQDIESYKSETFQTKIVGKKVYMPIRQTVQLLKRSLKYNKKSNSMKIYTSTKMKEAKLSLKAVIALMDNLSKKMAAYADMRYAGLIAESIEQAIKDKKLTAPDNNEVVIAKPGAEKLLINGTDLISQKYVPYVPDIQGFTTSNRSWKITVSKAVYEEKQVYETIDVIDDNVSPKSIVVRLYPLSTLFEVEPYSLLNSSLLDIVPPDLSKEKAENYLIKTEKGDIQIAVYPELMPITVANFMKLVSEAFYNGLTFHRVEEWVIQGGDPKGDGTGGSKDSIKLETNNKLRNSRGMIAMARNNDPNSATSQFYILKQNASWLNGQYAVFGKVTSGMEVVDKIAKGDKMLSIAQIK